MLFRSRAIQPDSFGAGVLGGREVVGKLEVGLQSDANAVRGDGRALSLGLRPLGRPVIVRISLDTPQRLLVRVEDDLIRRAVDDHELAWSNESARIVQPHDRWNFERARQNCGVIGAAAGVGGESADLRPVQLGGDRRGQLVGNEDGRLVDIAEEIRSEERRVGKECRL